MEGYRPSTYGDGFADVYDQWYADVSPPAATAEFIASLTATVADPTRVVVELGSGTGRLAGPLGDSGIAVVGLDASVAMLARSREGAPNVPVVAADMSEPPLRAGCASVVFVAFNTLFNLPTVALQRHALTRAAELVGADGMVVVEAFVPDDRAGPDGTGPDGTGPDGTGSDTGASAPGWRDHVDVVRLDADVVVLRVSRSDPASRTVSGHHIELRDGAPVRLRPWHLRYDDPAGLDRLAARCGLDCTERYSDWARTPFDESSSIHVSVYRPTTRVRPGGPAPVVSAS